MSITKVVKPLSPNQGDRPPSRGVPIKDAFIVLPHARLNIFVRGRAGVVAFVCATKQVGPPTHHASCFLNSSWKTGKMSAGLAMRLVTKLFHSSATPR